MIKASFGFDVTLDRFLRKLEASGMRNLNEKVHLIFARGPVTGKLFVAHLGHHLR